MAFYIHHDARQDRRKFDSNDLSLKGSDIRRAMHQESDATPLLTKIDRGDELTADEKKQYKKIYIRIYSRRYRQIHKNELRDYHRNYAREHPEVQERQKKRYRDKHPRPERYAKR